MLLKAAAPIEDLAGTAREKGATGFLDGGFSFAPNGEVDSLETPSITSLSNLRTWVFWFSENSKPPAIAELEYPLTQSSAIFSLARTSVVVYLISPIEWEGGPVEVFLFFLSPFFNSLPIAEFDLIFSIALTVEFDLETGFLAKISSLLFF